MGGQLDTDSNKSSVEEHAGEEWIKEQQEEKLKWVKCGENNYQWKNTSKT